MTAPVQAGGSLEAMLADPAKMDRGRVAREFEALLMSHVWKGAMKPMGASKLLDGGSAGRMYRELMIDEVVRRAALSRGLGLAQEMIRQLELPPEDPRGAPAAGTAARGSEPETERPAAARDDGNPPSTAGEERTGG